MNVYALAILCSAFYVRTVDKASAKSALLFDTGEFLQSFIPAGWVVQRATMAESTRLLPFYYL